MSQTIVQGSPNYLRLFFLLGGIYAKNQEIERLGKGIKLCKTFSGCYYERSVGVSCTSRAGYDSMDDRFYRNAL